ncbi:MAG: discoidin domain-containing protein [Puniceicoccales bacterium]|jgi:hypothetical protein|nr:discoidin domain-containing protein [Puniceicoccales bacterium]
MLSFRFFFLTLISCVAVSATARADSLVKGFQNPPDSARLWAYWDWLAGNVTAESITRDITEMKEKGFGGAVIFDVDDNGGDGNATLPKGPMYSSAEWRDLYLHTLREANRNGISISLSIQSGWNLGGPFVKPEHAAKVTTFSEKLISGPRKVSIPLPLPRTVNKFYRDIALYAIPVKKAPRHGIHTTATASSTTENYPPSLAIDGNPQTFWVSEGTTPEKPVSPKNPQHFFLGFNKPVSVNKLSLLGRDGYGPKDCELFFSTTNGETWTSLVTFSTPADKRIVKNFPSVTAARFRLSIYTSYDRAFAKTPRNAQIAEIALFNGATNLVSPHARSNARLSDLRVKTAHTEYGGSSPDCLPFLLDEKELPNDAPTPLRDVRVITKHLSADGTLNWDVPAGDWIILRLGYTQSGNHVSTASGKWQGFTIDYLSREALNAYWKQSVEPLLKDAGALAGKTLRYLHTDSWECGGMNWTPDFIQEFEKRRGYNPLPFLPIIAGQILNDRKTSNRFLNDFRRTIGDCIRDRHYALIQDMAAKYDIGIHPESGGPHGAPIDSLQLLGLSDIPMSEFWSWSPRHRVGDINRFFLKQPASAAHVYGKKIVAAEAFTNIGMHWQESFSDNLKPSFDQALCEGLNLVVWHGVANSPKEMGMPGQEFFAGTHFNPNNFTFQKSHDFLRYINRSQFLLQQGLFFADVLQYYGENVPNFTQMKWKNTAKSLPFYDYDVATQEALLSRASVNNGKITFPDGAEYRLLVLPERNSISLPVLKKIARWVKEDGLAVIGPKPLRVTGLSTKNEDAEVEKIANELWGNSTEKVRHVGKGIVATNISAAEFLKDRGLPPDFARISGNNPKPRIDSIHRVLYKNQLETINLGNFSEFSPKDVLTTPADKKTGVAAHLYFVANLTASPDVFEAAFRVTGLQPELWDALTGERRLCKAYRQENGRTIVPLDLAKYGSIFVVFRNPISPSQQGEASSNSPATLATLSIDGAWDVSFSKRWGGPEKVVFEKLTPWNEHADPRIRYYSGPAVYKKTFTVPPTFLNGRGRVFLQVGNVSEIAQVSINGKTLGTLWAHPYKMEITNALRPANNELEIEVVNHWSNRVIGDAALPKEKRLTRTNIRRLTSKTPLTRSGMEGKVELIKQD